VTNPGHPQFRTTTTKLGQPQFKKLLASFGKKKPTKPGQLKQSRTQFKKWMAVDSKVRLLSYDSSLNA
jgi:hypothetical protein